MIDHDELMAAMDDMPAFPNPWCPYRCTCHTCTEWRNWRRKHLRKVER